MSRSLKIAVCCVVATLAAAALTSPALAGSKVLDGTLDICGVEQFYGPIATDGSTVVQIGTFDADEGLSNFGTTCEALTDPTTVFQPFSINFYGTEYSEFHLNENGILSFGGAITDDPTTDLFALTLPAIAPFFADGFLPSETSVEFGYGTNSFWLTWFQFEEEGSATGDSNSFQLAFFDQGNGDFDLILNYDFIEWDPGQAGFTDGLGNGYLFPGALQAAGYIGDFEAFPDPICTANSLSCNNFNQGPFSTDISGDPRTGLHRFEFRDGVPLATPEIPLPAAAWLFLVGAAGLSAHARGRSSQKD